VIGQSFSTEAIVVNLQNRGEKDILVTFLTPNHGKIIVKAAGVKSIKSSRGANLQLGNITNISLRQNNGIYWLSECLATNSFMFEQKKLIQLNLLFYFLEIVKNVMAAGAIGVAVGRNAWQNPVPLALAEKIKEIIFK